MTHKEFAEKDEGFKKACEAAGLPPTKRQAGKYRRGVGAAKKGLTVTNTGTKTKK